MFYLLPEDHIASAAMFYRTVLELEVDLREMIRKARATLVWFI